MSRREILLHRRRAHLLAIRAELAFLGIARHGDHDQSEHGNWASGGGGSGPRESLASASSTQEISAAASSEARAITGRDIGFNFDGADPDVAREHAEGVLRGLERSPSTPLSGVGTYGPGGSLGEEFEGDPGNAVAINGTLGFNNALSGPEAAADYRADLKDNAESGFNTGDGTPVSVGVHEFAHVATSRVAEVQVERNVEGTAQHFKVDPNEYIEREVSGYAVSDTRELIAEAFTDVVMNGSSASELSHQIYRTVVENPPGR